MMPGALMFIKALTSLHPGAGTALGAIDLPIQREAHTNWPMIQGGSVKGVLRDGARRATAAAKSISLDEADKDPDVTRAFGPPVEEAKASEFGGSLVVSDARIVAFPVRSLKGVFALITCPMAIKRLVDDCRLAGVSAPDAPGVVGEGQCLCAASDLLFFEANNAQQAVIEDFAVTRTGDGAAAGALADWLGVEQGRLVVVHNDLFTFCVRFRTEVITRNALDPETKTVSRGALWSEEFLPPETRLYSVLCVDQVYSPDGDADGVMGYVTEWVDGKGAQFGGDASTGKGICALSLKIGAGEGA